MRDDAAAQNAATEQYAPKARRRAVDFDDDEPEPGRRVRVRLRGGLLPQSKWGRIAAGGTLLVLLGMMLAGVLSTRTLLMHDARFVVDSSEAIEIHGNAHVTRAALLSVFGGDLERNIFFVPLAERRAELEKMPWVQHATVMRLLPGRLRVEIVERTPVAFVRQGAKIGLVDAGGVLLEMPADTHYSFPVLLGISADDPASVREARMKLYMSFLVDLDSSGQEISEQLSEVDLSSPEDVKATIPESSGEVLVHFGDGDYMTRYRKFEQHLPEWLTQYPKLASVDMRYDRQVVLEMQPGSEGAAVPAPPAAPGSDVASAAPAPVPAVEGKTPASAVKAVPVTHVSEARHAAPGSVAVPRSAATPAMKAVPVTHVSQARHRAPASAAATKAQKAARTKAMLARGRVLKEQQAQAANR